MFWALATILVAYAAFGTAVIARRPTQAGLSPRLDADQVKGFVYVGAAALVVLAGVVITLGLVWADSGRAEGLAVLGFLGYALYMAAAAGMIWFTSRRGR